MSTDERVYTTGAGSETAWSLSSPRMRQHIELMHKYKSMLQGIPGVNSFVPLEHALIVGIHPDAKPEDKARIPRTLDGCTVEVVETIPELVSAPFNSRILPLAGATELGSWSSTEGGMICAIAQSMSGKHRCM